MWRYIKSAFNGRPIGMFIPPNWVGLAAFGLLGALVNPGFLLLGAGLELAYLLTLSTNGRFQRLVDAQGNVDEQKQWDVRLKAMLSELGREDQQRYRALETRCRIILGQRAKNDLTAHLQTQSEGLGRLLWIYLRLLHTRQSLMQVLREAGTIDEPLERRLDRLGRQLKDEALGDDLRRSYEGQLQILHQRLAKQAEAKQKLAFLNAELSRIEQQVELIREQSIVSHDPNALSQRIDEVGATLTGTSNWIRDQQRIYGAMSDLLEDPPPVTPLAPPPLPARKVAE